MSETFIGTRGGPTPPRQRGAIGDTIDGGSTFIGSQGGPTPPKTPWDKIQETKNELARPSFALHAAQRSTSITTQGWQQQQQQEQTQYDHGLAHASGVRHHDQRSLDHKLNPALRGKRDLHQQSTGGSGGNGGSGGCSSNQCDKGGGHCGTGCACCNNEQEVTQCYQGNCGTNCSNCGSGGGGGGGGGGGKGGGGKGGGGKGGKGKGGKGGGGRGRGLGGGGLAGPGALGNFPQLGAVPLGATSPTSGPSPVIVIGLLAIAAVIGYFIWHKLRVDRTVDKQLDKGKAAVTDAAA